MAEDSAPNTERQAKPPSTVARLARLALVAAGLLAASEVLWLWQTWPVRELLRAPVVSAPPAPGQ
jgi:hypothetical protein